MAGKMFAGEALTDAVLGASIGAEAASGIGLPLAFISAGILGTIKIAHAVKHKKEEKANSKREEEERNRIDEANRIEQERQRQLELEEIARQQERDRLKAEEDARIAEQQRIEAERQAQIRAQQEAEQQRQEENKAFENQIQVRNEAIEDQLAQDRARRLQGRDVSIYANYYDPNNPGNVLFFEPENENWRLIEGNRLNIQGGNPELNPYRSRAEFDNPDLPYPDGDADDPNAGGGGNGGNGGNGGGGYPDNDPAHNNFNQQGRPNRNRGGNYIIGNPFSDVINQISKKIAENRERERPPPDAQFTEGDVEQPILGKDGHGQWIFDPNRQQPIGGNPETWSPTDQNYPGKNGGGIYNPNNPYITKENDDVNLMENELLAIINNQGLAELNQEDIVTNTKQSIYELQRLENQVSGLLPPQAMVGASSVFTSAISRF